MLVNFNGRQCHVTDAGYDDEGRKVDGSPLFGVVYLLPDNGQDHTGDFRYAYEAAPVKPAPSTAAKPLFSPPPIQVEPIVAGPVTSGLLDTLTTPSK